MTTSAPMAEAARHRFSLLWRGLVQGSDPQNQSLGRLMDRIFTRISLAAGAILVATAATLVAGGLVLNTSDQYSSNERTVVQANEVAMLNLETGVRGFLLTDQRQFLQPYYLGQSQLVTSDAQLATLASHRDLLPLLINLRVAEAKLSAFWGPSVADPGPLIGNRAELTAALLEGKQLFDAYRQQQAALAARVVQLSQQASAAPYLLLALLLALQLAIYVHLFRKLHIFRRRTRLLVVDPLGGLTAAVLQVADGSRVTEIPTTGPVEIRAMSAAVTDLEAQLETERHSREVKEEALERQSRRLRVVLAAVREIAGSHGLAQISRSSAEGVRHLCGATRVAVWIVHFDGTLAPVLVRTAGASTPATALADLLPSPPLREATEFGKAVPLDSASGITGLAVPMLSGGRVVGVLEVSGDPPHGPLEEDLPLLETLASHTGAAMESARLSGEAEVLSRTDSLTQLPNRRSLDSDLRLEWERCRRYRTDLSFVMLDIDHFKGVNDERGPQVGDEVLAQVASVLRVGARATDTVYRYGGEEFAILARGSDQQSTVQLAERLRMAVEESSRTGPRPQRITISAGVASVSTATTTAESVVRLSNVALYRAKRLGRNRTCAATPAEALHVAAEIAAGAGLPARPRRRRETRREAQVAG